MCPLIRRFFRQLFVRKQKVARTQQYAPEQLEAMRRSGIRNARRRAEADAIWLVSQVNAERDGMNDAFWSEEEPPPVKEPSEE